MYCLSIKKDEEHEGYLYFGVPVEDLKGKFDLLRFTTDEKYYDENIDALISIVIKEAEQRTYFTYNEASLFGFLEGKVWIHCKVNRPIDTIIDLQDLMF